MKIEFVKIGFLLLFVLSFSHGSLGQLNKNGLAEQKIQLLENLYQQGDYPSCLAEAKKLEKEKSLMQDGHAAASLVLYQVKVQYAVFSFVEAAALLDKLVKSLDTINTPISRALLYGELAAFYSEIGSYKEAANAFAKTIVVKDSIDKLRQIKLELVHCDFLLGQQYLVETKASLNRLEVLFKDSTFIIGKTEEEQMEWRLFNARFITSKLRYLVRSGKFVEVEKEILLARKQLKDLVGIGHAEYSKCLELEAEVCWERHHFDKGAQLYKEAYSTLATGDYQQYKIYLLYKVASTSIHIGDVTSYEQYMRRIQLHADRNLHKFNYFQLILGYSNAYNYFVKGEYAAAISKIKKTESNFSSLPPNHRMRLASYGLQSAIYLEDAQMKGYQAVLDTIYKLSAYYVGENSPTSQQALLAYYSNQIRMGTGLGAMEQQLTNSYKQVVPKLVDSTSMLSVQYSVDLAELYFQTDRFELAYFYSNQATRIAKVLYGKDSWEYSMLFLKNMKYAAWDGQYNSALTHYSELEAMDKNIQALQKTFQYIRFLHASLAGRLVGDFFKTNVHSLKAFKLLESEQKNQRLVFSDVREQAAVTYIELSNVYVAERILLQSLQLKVAKLGANDPSLLSVYKELTHLYSINGNFTQADNYLTSYLNLSSQLYGTNSIVYSLGLNLAGEYYKAIGDYTRAKESLEQAVKIQQKSLVAKHLVLADTYLALAQVEVKLHPEKFIANEKAFKLAGKIIEETIGKENQLYANYLQALAEFYISFARYNLALDMLTQANSFWESKLGLKNVHSADIYMLLGKISYLKSQYPEAEQYYSKARSIYETIFSESHPSYSSATAKLAKVAYMLGDKNKSLSLMEVCMPKYLAYVENYFPSLSFQEKSKFWFGMRDEFEFYNFLMLSSFAKTNRKMAGDVYNTTIATKALLLSSDIKLRKQISESGDTLLIRMFNDWVTQKELLTNMVSLNKEAIEQQGLDPRKIELQLEILEKNMSTRSELFQSESKKATPTWKDIQGALGQNEYAVELVRYRYFDKVFKDSSVYAALILSKKNSDGPELVILPNGKAMETRSFKYNKFAILFDREDEYSYGTYWQPIKSIVPDNALVYLSSEGVYNQLNVEMLFNTANQKYVLDENSIVQVTNTKDIIPDYLARKSKATSIKQTSSDYVLCGNPQFYTSSIEFRKSIEPLPGAEAEVKKLSELIRAAGRPCLTFMNEQVTEDTLKSFKNPLALHIASHGYFKESNEKESDDFAANPLLNSGLMLSGSGNIVDNKLNSYVNSTDGILTAYEVVNMNLDKTEVVVLSACETGKGQLKAGEGVYGLQRSFLVAGADCVILSLFKVNDAVTKELMVAFYTKWLATGDKRTAFIGAKKLIKEKYTSPIFWGAFIMIEGKPQRKQMN